MLRRNSSSHVVTVAGMLLLCPAALFGQVSRGSILGQVTDPTAAAIAGAVVTITRADTNETVETRTDDEGYYSFAFLDAGSYRIAVSAAGFRPSRVDHIRLETDSTRDLTITLQVGDLQERVAVSASKEAIETTTASRVQRVDSKKLRELPLIGRQAYSLVSLTPGVVFTQEQFGTNGFAGLRGWDANGRFIMNGGKEGTNQFLLNGAPVSLTGRWQFSPNVDAIQEFKVMTNTYDAQFGRTGGGTVVTTLKSGTNRWRGSIYEYLHNALLDANSTQNNRYGLPRGKHITNQFGGVIGGPIRREKDFLFLSFEGFREIVPFPVVSDTVPLDLRNGDGFALYGLRVYDPRTAHECRVGVNASRCVSSFIRDQFPRNRIPASRISPIGRRILSLFPGPNVDGFSQNYVADGNVGRYQYTQPLGRWDHHQGERNRFNFVAAAELGRDIISENGFPAPIDTGRNADRLSQHYIAEWVHIKSANTVLDFRLSFGRFAEAFPDSTRTTTLTPLDLGIGLLPKPPNVAEDLAPRINLDLFSPIIGNSFTWATTNHWVAQPNIVHSRGRHVFHFGAEAAYAAIGNTNIGRANGEFSFNRSWTQQFVNRPDGTSRNLGARDGSGIADLLLGVPSSGFIDYNDSFYRTWPYYAIYFEDNWRVAPKLTLTLGLRYDVQIPMRERFNRVNAGFDFTSKNPLSDQVIARWKQVKREYDATNPDLPYPDAPAALYGGRLFASDSNPRPHQTDWTNIQPRVGVAWNFAPRTVLRAGFGVFHRTATQLSQTSGFNQRTNYISSIDGIVPSAGIYGPWSLENPFPLGIQTPTGSSLGLLTNVGRAVNFDGRQRPIPRTFQYSIGFQRELPGKFVLDISYAGSQTIKDSTSLQVNAVSFENFLRGGDDPNFLNRRLPSPFYGILPPDSDLGSSLTVTGYNLLRPNPLFTGIVQTTNPWARYRYDSLQVIAERKYDDMAAGVFTFLFSYTYAKSFEQARLLNDWNVKEQPVKQLTAFDKPHTLAWSGLWELPVGWGRRYLSGVNRFAGGFLNGWSLDWILAYNAGYPVARPDAQFLCDSYAAPGGQTPSSWFNNDPGCWTARPQYTLRTGEDRFSGIRNPSAPQLHLSVEKLFWLNDRYSLQLRGESFNLTNTPILPGPNTNFRDPRFGQIPVSQNNFPRFVQLSLRLSF